MDALKEKRTQFPSGIKFFLSTPPVESTANDHTLAELRTFLSSQGMSVAGEKRVLRRIMKWISILLPVGSGGQSAETITYKQDELPAGNFNQHDRLLLTRGCP
jgi:hypothetical protein